jgi:predicted DNA-binding antitoxin AbrB/MazE fold protein
MKNESSIAQAEWVRAIYRDGVLQLLESVDLPDGAELWVELRTASPLKKDSTSSQQAPSYPTLPQPPESLSRLIGMIAVGGDALADSEALYDADRH